MTDIKTATAAPATRPRPRKPKEVGLQRFTVVGAIYHRTEADVSLVVDAQDQAEAVCIAREYFEGFGNQEVPGVVRGFYDWDTKAAHVMDETNFRLYAGELDDACHADETPELGQYSVR